MQGYVCAERGTETPAVALCHSCQAGLCLEHLREAAERFATDNMLAGCHHDTWSVTRDHRRQTRLSARWSPRAARDCDRPGYEVRTLRRSDAKRA